MGRTKRRVPVQHEATSPATGVWSAIVTCEVADTVYQVENPSPELRSLDIQNQHATALVFFGDSTITSDAGATPGQRLAAGALKSLAVNQAGLLRFSSDTNSTIVSLFGLTGHG